MDVWVVAGSLVVCGTAVRTSSPSGYVTRVADSKQAM